MWPHPYPLLLVTYVHVPILAILFSSRFRSSSFSHFSSPWIEAIRLSPRSKNLTLGSSEKLIYSKVFDLEKEREKERESSGEWDGVKTVERERLRNDHTAC